jgi:hypothetical protein
VSSTPDGPDAAPVAEPVPQTARPPVPPRPAPSGELPVTGPGNGPADEPATGPAAEPMTGQLDLGGYPPRVPGAGRPRPVRDDPAEDGGSRHGR